MTTVEWPEWQVTKLDAARRQLQTAIQLLFSQGDGVSTHTLAHASFGILKDVAKHRGRTRISDAGNELAGNGQKDFWSRFNRTGNFFKHADKDPDGFLEGLSEEENEALISLAIEIYCDMGCIATPEIDAFKLWWRCIHFCEIENVTEPFISWIEKNYSRLHAESRSELLTLGNELLTLVRDSET